MAQVAVAGKKDAYGLDYSIGGSENRADMTYVLEVETIGCRYELDVEDGEKRNGGESLGFGLE